MHRGVHPERLHSLQVRRVDLVDVRQRPAEAGDRAVLVDDLDLIEERVNGAGQVGVDVQLQPGLCHAAGDPPPLEQIAGDGAERGTNIGSWRGPNTVSP